MATRNKAAKNQIAEEISVLFPNAFDVTAAYAVVGAAVGVTGYAAIAYTTLGIAVLTGMSLPITSAAAIGAAAAFALAKHSDKVAGLVATLAIAVAKARCALGDAVQWLWSKYDALWNSIASLFSGSKPAQLN